MNISRRWFIGGAASFGALAGCRVLSGKGLCSLGAPRLTFGVVSDIHIRDLAKRGDDAFARGMNELTFVHTLEYFRDQGADGVIIAGDMADSGVIRQLENVATAWYRVFPGDRAPDGRKVEKLFVYGNHDMGGVPYARSALGMVNAPESAFEKLIIYPNPKAVWEKTFHEPFEPIWTKTVRGYRFVGAQWWSQQGCNGDNERFNSGIADWYAQHAKEIDPSLPFFHIQHPHPRNTCYGPWAWGSDEGLTTKALSAFSNAVAFSGHSHYSLTDERSVWQGAFTSVGTSSLRYTGLGYHEFAGGFLNSNSGGADKRERDAAKMVAPYNGYDCRQGMLWRVYDDCMTVERREFVSDLDVGENWVIPLPSAEPKPFAFAARAKKIGAPEFKDTSSIALSRINGKTRGAKKKGGRVELAAIPSADAPALKIVIPPALAKDGARAYQFEIEVASAADGKKVLNRQLAEGFNQASAHPRAHGMTTCVLPLDELPKGKLAVTVTPLNCYGRKGRSLTAEISV